MNKKLPVLYQELLAPYLTTHQWLRLSCLILLISHQRWVRLEDLANRLPQTIKFESRRRSLQRLLDLPSLTFEKLWFPILKIGLKYNFPAQDVIYVPIDRTRWSLVNLLGAALVYRRRALPICIRSLAKKENSNLYEQQELLSPVLELLQDYTVVILGDREFCSVELARWLREQKRVYFCLRLKKNTYIKQKSELWVTLTELGLSPGVSLYI